MTRDASIGLVGGGNFARTTILPAIDGLSGLRFESVATATGESAKSIADQYDFRRCTTDYAEVLDDDAVDLVVIATRHDLHADLAVEALSADKNVHLEKPLALTRAGLDRVIKAERESAGRLMVGYNRRFAGGTRAIKRDLTGRATPLMVNYRVNVDPQPDHWIHDPDEGGGRILGEVCHFIDFLQYLADSPPETVYASRVPPRNGLRPDENVTVVVEFEDGTTGNLLYTALGDESVPKERVEVFGNGSVHTIDNFKTGPLAIDQDKGHENEFKAFRNAILKDRPSPIPMDELVYTSVVTFDIVQSIRERDIIEVELPASADAESADAPEP